MALEKFRKRPLVVEAMRYVGDNLEQLREAFGYPFKAINDGAILVPTKEGTLAAKPGEWIIRGIAGELYPCDPDIFGKTYEQVTYDEEA